MKKILLLSAVLVGAVSAAQAGVDFHFGIGLPLLPPPPFVVSRPAPVYVAPAPPVCVEPVPVCPPAIVIAPRPYYYGGPRYYGNWHHDYDRRDWDRGHGGWGHDRDHGHGHR